MTHDYGPYTPAPPTADAIATRDRLADELAKADTTGARVAAEKALVSHMLEQGLPLEDFSTPSGRAFVVTVSVSPPRPKPGKDREARRWLSAQRTGARTLAHKLLARGGGLSAELFEPLNPRVNVKAA